MANLPPFMELPPTPEEPRKPKSWKKALLLTLLFGPLGLFYASRAGGFLMTWVCIVVGIGTVGVGLLLAWPVCMLWAYVATASQEEPPVAG